MEKDQYLRELLDPGDDRAWKLAVGEALHEVVQQTRKTNGRVSNLEEWRNRMLGALGFIAITAPIAAAVLVKVMVK